MKAVIKLGLIGFSFILFIFIVFSNTEWANVHIFFVLIALLLMGEETNEGVTGTIDFLK